jgi:crotonobetainyl-CoA:carnitine CoA-transferase CaiB-like acyl-CoA transferase
MVAYVISDPAARRGARAAPHDRLFARLCQAVGLDELVDDPRFATNEARVEHADAFADALNGVMRLHPSDHWVSKLQDASVPVGTVNEVDEAFALAERLGLEPTEGHLIRPPLRIDGARPPIRHAPPRLDEHGDDLREWLGGGSGRR